MRRWSIASLFALLLWVPWSVAAERVLAVAERDLRPAEVIGVHGFSGHDMAVVVLRVAGEELPIFTGIYEAEAIERARRKITPPRPYTHDLLADVLARADLELVRVVIDELRDDGHFLAALEVRKQGGGKLQRIDARPSDGIALAIRQGVPIVIARQVVEAARQAPDPQRADPRPPVVAQRNRDNGLASRHQPCCKGRMSSWS